MSVVSTGLLRWVKGEIGVGEPWHLSFDGRNVECGMQHWGGPPLRPHVRDLKNGPPPITCGNCKIVIARKLDLDHPMDAMVPK